MGRCFSKEILTLTFRIDCIVRVSESHHLPAECLLVLRCRRPTDFGMLGLEYSLSKLFVNIFDFDMLGFRILYEN